MSGYDLMSIYHKQDIIHFIFKDFLFEWAKIFKRKFPKNATFVIIFLFF